MAEISAGWMSILLSSHGGAKPFELRAQRRIDHARSHFHDETAEKRRVDFGIEPRIAAELGFERRAQLRDFRIAQRARGRHLGSDFAALPGSEKFEGADHIDKHEEAALGG